jgi:hypothetical protein
MKLEISRKNHLVFWGMAKNNMMTMAKKTRNSKD